MARYKIPQALVLHYKISAGAGQPNSARDTVFLGTGPSRARAGPGHNLDMCPSDVSIIIALGVDASECVKGGLRVCPQKK